MAGTWDQDRQRTEEFREEQLDWLHQQHQQMARQTYLLEQIARHTGLVYAVMIVWLVLAGLGFLVYLVALGSF